MSITRTVHCFVIALFLSAVSTAFAVEGVLDRAASIAPPGKPRDVKDVDSVPYLNEEGRAQYQRWLSTPFNRAFAVSPKDGSWGLFPDDAEAETIKKQFQSTLRGLPIAFVVQDALERCQKKSGDKCFLYAQNGDVVWDGSIPQLTKVALKTEPVDEVSRLKAALAKAEEANRQREAATQSAAVQTSQDAASAAGQKSASKAAPRVGQRKALIFGNDSYQFIPTLKNARADAKAMAKTLTGLGYTVQTHLDANERDMKKAIRDFTRGVAGGDEVLFFYAGHGVQIGSANYLLPVDLRAEDAGSVRDEAIPLQRVLDDMSESKAKLTLAVIDACRDNPFKMAGRAIGGRGLAPTSAATGQMVMFSAGTGQQALDNVGANDKSPNGLFTRVFLKHLQKKGVTVDRIMRDVRSEVVAIAESVGHEQVPAIYDQVVGDFYFAQ